MAHILVVDDDAQIRSALSEFIGKIGHSVETAEDGVKALKYIDGHKVDLVILDIIMPEQDGIGTILHLMKSPQQPPIIAISGGSRHFDENFVHNIVNTLSNTVFLQKPFSLEEMGSAIKKALSEKCAND